MDFLIQFTSENLLELKQFRPNENVIVDIAPVQVSMLDHKVAEGGRDAGAEMPLEDWFNTVCHNQQEKDSYLNKHYNPLNIGLVFGKF